MARIQFYASNQMDLSIVRTENEKFVNYGYFIVDKTSRKTLVIDPAWDLEIFKELIDRNGTGLTYILLTHSHNDHTNLADKLAERYGSKICMSEIEMEYYDFKVSSEKYELIDNQVIELGAIKINCLLTPGHTAGSMCFFVENCLFTGDTVFIEGCGHCNSVGASAEQLYDSVQRLMRTMKSNVKVYPGHSYELPPGIEFSELYNYNIYFNIDEKQMFVEFRMRPRQEKNKFV